MAKKAKKAAAKKGGGKPRSKASRAVALDGVLGQLAATFNSYDSSGTRKITSDDFDQLNEALRTRQDKQATLRDQMGSAIGNAVEHQFLHRKAHSHFRQLDKMEPEKLAEFLFHFFHYCTMGGIFERAASVRSLDLDDGGEGGEGGEQAGGGESGESEPEVPAKAAAPAGDNVSRPRFPGAINTKTGVGAFEQPAAGNA